jgi:hypothetical protein
MKYVRQSLQMETIYFFIKATNNLPKFQCHNYVIILITVNCTVMYNFLILINGTNEEDVLSFDPTYLYTY